MPSIKTKSVKNIIKNLSMKRNQSSEMSFNSVLFVAFAIIISTAVTAQKTLEGKGIIGQKDWLLNQKVVRRIKSNKRRIVKRQIFKKAENLGPYYIHYSHLFLLQLCLHMHYAYFPNCNSLPTTKMTLPIQTAKS